VPRQVTWEAAGVDDPGVDFRTVVLVEGGSDRAAVETLAVRSGRDLRAEGVAVVDMGGATNIARCLGRYGPGGLDLRLAGLCDEQEAGEFRRALLRAGLPGELEANGFFVCVRDLEDELIRALGHERVEQVAEAAGELRAFRTLQRQAPHVGRSTQDQLRRFMGSGGGRKIRYGRLLAEALDLDHVPPPLEALLARL
jgi:hypothetical protein